MSVSMNGAIGSSTEPSVSGYDAFSISSRWVPGTNNIGKRISINFGASNWFNPAQSTIYKDSVLTYDEKIKEAQNSNFVMAGLACQILDNRDVSSKDYAVMKKERDELYLKLTAAKDSNNTIRIREIENCIADLNWRKVIREKLRKPSWLIGGTFRLSDIGTETTIDVTDIYSSFAIGKGIFDYSASVHYIKPLEEGFMLDNAITGSMGFFLDLDDAPPISTFGIVFGIGNYTYIEKERLYNQGLDNELKFTDTPSTIRYDITLSFSDIFQDSGPFGSSIAFRYSLLDHKSTNHESQFSILFSTKFINSKNN
jgi:hypothetical protein